ncbi:hypothetical protein KL933_003656 [Ogataea haglerorum]|uniref:Trehalase n=1 Tax=Ogataea haglerorum TaxID=1937702 RepID=A0AAN6D3K0_9ASCO|nr:uncharacterized protein KL911_003982 [Ogataea haglerorum]KAG7694523.1 hypothetical protein KL915_003490 [Ogataea haglerorum]KAG7695277.1 hypothetical protein KL951_003719 [Ogataea haglerorum]KAG7705398.1 hypothetical protein KL950_003834 [Ogataea haglerorum]KAG7726214.1 hypothetical protein KL933_003656 [Ogataea haglerorum]KAG7729543.1 hypothetical protein KL948_003697 [Ogataea haglerorum]
MPTSHKRQSSIDDVDPFATADLYYGPKTDPSKSNKASRYGRTRTLSAVIPNRKVFQFSELTPSPTATPPPNGSATFDMGHSSNDEDDSAVSETPSEAGSALHSPSESTSSLVKEHNLEVVNSQKLYSLPGVSSGTVNSASSNATLRRRGSADDSSSMKNSKRFFISDIDATLEELLENEDTDKNYQITIEDSGPKVLKLGTANSNGYRQYDIRGTYMLSNLLQELTIAKRMGRKQMILDEARLNENPVNRLKRLISNTFWRNLTRTLDEHSIINMASDTKIDTPEARIPRVYVPHNQHELYAYYQKLAEKCPEHNLQVEYLPEHIDGEYIKSINHKPGLLALATRRRSQEYADLEGYPYVVPGGRFNEQYGWDSYFETLGLLLCDIVDPCIGMCENFIFEIENYGKILNANRSYYLGRSQPPFLTDMALHVFHYLEVQKGIQDLGFLERTVKAAIKEYNTVWCSPPRLDPETGLSCYHPEGKGIPPETEATHFCAVLKPYCEKYGVSFEEFTKKYNDGEIVDPELDEYFLHDRAVRESGHDTSYRLEGVCAYLATVDLNSLLYKYEKDIAFIIGEYFDNHLEFNGQVETAEKWEFLAAERKKRIDKYLWNESKGMYFDYNIKTHRQSLYESATTFYPLWAKLASREQAKALVEKALPRFEVFGGIVSGTKESRGEIGLNKPSRQWDYPYAWSPHQIMTWRGLQNYGYTAIAKRLSYRWCYLITLAFVDFNGIVVEKYDATSEQSPHKVDAEYGNQGSDFKGVATEGFGWVNAGYLLGLENLDTIGIRALGLVTSPNNFFPKLNEAEKRSYGL